jgi:hypothetical protein
VSRTRPAAASSTLDSSDRFKTNRSPAPVTRLATNTTDAQTIAERVEIPQLAGRSL